VCSCLLLKCWCWWCWLQCSTSAPPVCSSTRARVTRQVVTTSGVSNGRGPMTFLDRKSPNPGGTIGHASSRSNLCRSLRMNSRGLPGELQESSTSGGDIISLATSPDLRPLLLWLSSHQLGDCSPGEKWKSPSWSGIFPVTADPEPARSQLCQPSYEKCDYLK
jgi:hypothetical protein